MENFDEDRPIYIQIGESIKRDIVSGRLKGGDKLPSIRDMSHRFKVNPNTIQRAYAELEYEGVTFTKRGMGTFIIDDDEKLYTLKTDMATKEIENFVDAMKELGFSSREIIELLKHNLKRK